jgi:membrane-associated PAP2 superfamily phosphatase
MSVQACCPLERNVAVDRPFLLHGVVIPAGLALVAFAIQSSGLDERVAAAFFDPVARTFPVRGWALLETLGHRVAKSAIIGLWLLLASAACTSAFFPRLRKHAAIIRSTVAAMALGPMIVVALKGLTAYRCPWDLAQFGGMASYASGWIVPRADAGHCFPSGHAAGGFSLIALFFAGRAAGDRGLQRAGLAAALVAGSLFSLVRITQGAHFLSHNLWSAAIDWFAAALVFAPFMTARGSSSGESAPIARHADGEASEARLLATALAVAAWFGVIAIAL